ncbi:hypothetical protein TNCV_2082741 [Trichonephila clavipes]|nr:hypothetical protein TNCV_2082741 [Trichonephila clavipes]
MAKNTGIRCPGIAIPNHHHASRKLKNINFSRFPQPRLSDTGLRTALQFRCQKLNGYSGAISEVLNLSSFTFRACLRSHSNGTMRDHT